MAMGLGETWLLMSIPRMKVKDIKVLAPDEDPDWFEWVLPEQINRKRIPRRSAVQDFFPFGVYISLGDMNAIANEKAKVYGI